MTWDYALCSKMFWCSMKLMPWSGSVPAEIRLKPEAAAETAKMADDPIVGMGPWPVGLRMWRGVGKLPGFSQDAWEKFGSFSFLCGRLDTHVNLANR